MDEQSELADVTYAEKSYRAKQLGLSITEKPRIFGDPGVLENLQEDLVVVVLAAGSGTRFRSDVPKVLYPMDGKPLVQHVIEAVKVTEAPVVVVIGHEGDRVRHALSERVALFVEQSQRLGTGHAVYLSRYAIPGDFAGDLMVLYADVPGVDASLLSAIIDSHRHFRSTDPAYGALVVTGSRSNSFNPASENYGRIIRDEVNPSCIREIVEKKQIDQLLEGDPRRRTLEEIDEFNSGIFVARAPALFRALGNAPPRQVGADRVEFYATDFVEHMVSRGLHVYAWQAPAEFQYKIEGANTIEELEEISQRRCTSAEPFRTQ